MKHSRVLLVNPPIYDFAAYDLWLKPLGLLYIASVLKQSGHEVNFIDCMDRFHPCLERPETDKRGCGSFHSLEIEKPPAYSHIPRKYHRFGIPKEAVVAQLKSIPKPDIVLVTSIMTYWYPGVFEAIQTIKQTFSNVPVVLGGNYATLCFDHAKTHSGADHVIASRSFKDVFAGLNTLGLETGKQYNSFVSMPAPLYSLYNNLPYAAVRLSYGCPFRCSYCAIETLSSSFEAKLPQTTIKEIEALIGLGITRFAFYDDALLYNSENLALPVFAGLARLNKVISIYTPNGLHARFITPEVAKAMKAVNFVIPRLSLESVNTKRQKESGGKLSNNDFENACFNLLNAGYLKGQYGAYILMGMPNQPFSEIEESIRFANKCGAKVYLVEYSPIPGTKDWNALNINLNINEPLNQNNSIFPLYPLSDWPAFQSLKNLAKELNKSFQQG